MNRALAALLLLLSSVAAGCSTKNVPLFGLDRPPDGTLLLQGDSYLHLEAVMDIDTPHSFRFRFNGKYGIMSLAAGDTGPFGYLEVDVQEWFSGMVGYTPLPAGTYVVEMVDESGMSWGQSPPVAVQAQITSSQPVTIIFAHVDAHDDTWVLDPATQDADPATMEVTVSNLSGQDAPVQRCLLPAPGVGAQSCTSLGTVAPGADFHTVETITPDTPGATPTVFPVLSVGSYQRQLIGTLGACEIERIVFTGTRTLSRQGTISPSLAFSACNGF